MADYGCYLAGILLLGKWGFQWRTGYRPIRWGSNPKGLECNPEAISLWVTRTLVVLTVVLVLYPWVGALNARAVYLWDEERFEYLEALAWLPSSYDSPATWQAFRNHLGFGCYFWALRDWLLTRTETECADIICAEGTSRRPSPIPARLRLLLWVLAINGAILSAEAIVQRLDGTPKVLWLKLPSYNPQAESQFGPFPYRANGAQYLNLLWPVILGFWWNRQRDRTRRGHDTRHHLLLPCVLIMIVGPLMSLSRGGALIAMTLVFGCAGLILWQSRGSRSSRIGLAAAAIAGAGALLGMFFAGRLWTDRMAQLPEGFADRTELTRSALRIVKDYPVFGTGPGTFQPVYQLYRKSLADYAPGQLHNDWVETLITFGTVGFTLVLGSLGLAWGRWYRPGGIPDLQSLAPFCVLAMGGCLVHAWFDLPFQVYSITLLFITLTGLVFTLSRAARA